MADTQQQLIWLGAGNATAPANLIAKTGKAVLVDARADACAALAKQFAGQSHVRVLHSVISEHGGDVSFTEYNLAEFSALHSTTGLSSLFPGLKPVKSQQQHSETVAALLQPLALSGDDNILVIDIADISLLLLKQLQAAKLLAHFSQIYVQSSAEALYQGAATQGELSQWLQQQGYTLTSQDTTDPDLPWLQFSLNPLWQTLQQSRAGHAQAEQAKAELAKQLEQAKQQVSTEKQQAEQAKAELAKQLEQVKQQAGADKQKAEQAQAELTKQLQQLTQQAEDNNKKSQQQALEQKHQFEQKLAELNTVLVNNGSEKDTLQQQVTAVKVAAEKTQAELNGLIAGKDAELKQALQQLETANQHISSATEQVNKQLHELAERDSQLAQCETTKTQLQQQLQQETEWHHKHKSWAESLKTQNEQLSKELKEQQRSSQLSIKLLAKVEADASELRQRYATLLTTEQELRNLVGELYIKLSAASKFYDKLEQDHPELLEKKP